MTMFNKVVKSFQYGDHKVRLETGEIARQATGAVLCDMDDTVVLATVVAKKEIKPGQDFFPLTVDYIEKTYAAGKIPGGFFKREGRPSEKETLTSRLIDRPIRPLFPEGFFNEVQIIIHVLSVNPEVDPDIPSMIAASAALAVSGVPFNGPIAAARVGYINNEYVLCPNLSQMKDSKLDLVVAGTERAVLMVESEADQLSEEVMLGAVMFGHEKMQVVIDAIDELVEEGGKPLWDWQPAPRDPKLVALITEIVGNRIHEAFEHRSKQDRNECLRAVYEDVNAKVDAAVEAGELSEIGENEVNNILFEMEAQHVRGKILNGEPRIDGRDTRTVRPIEIRTGVLPRAHGSALFTRGETQALVVTTLGTKQDEQVVDSLTGEQRERFMLHYNMPPFATGETGRVGSPKRREIGHGKLAWRAIHPMMPKDKDAFPYTIRVVSEILESNGSTSQGSICASTLSLMAAGVPIKAPVAGISVGLVTGDTDDDYLILTDIQGLEDFFGDMDFKVAGTKKGITAIQMDIKIHGLTREIVEQAIARTREARLYILDEVMAKAIAEPRKEVNAYAPKIKQIMIDPAKIGEVVGQRGKTINALIERTGVKIDITDDGAVSVCGTDKEAMDEALRLIEIIVTDFEKGQILEGTVVSIKDFGAFIEFAPGKEGMVHISNIANRRINHVEDELTLGDKVKVICLGKDKMGRISFSIKDVPEE